MFWNIVLAIISFAAQLIFAPKPQNAKPKSLEDFQFPTADEGREIPVFFGTNDDQSPNVTWYGDLKKSAIKGARRYGFFGPRQVIGYKYRLGMQQSICHGPADAIMRITVGDKLAWKGTNTGGRLTINKPKLFGGDQSEGGISGDVDICMGAPDQLQNDYLLAKVSPTISAFRGVVTAVLRQVYLGTSNYIKPWEWRIQRIMKRSDGSDQWYPEKAKIPAEATTADNIAFYFALDTSASVIGVRMNALNEAVHDAIATMRANTDIKYDVRMVSFGSSVKGSKQYRNAKAEDFDALDVWVDDLTSSGHTNFEAGLSEAQAFFDGADSKKTPCVIILSDNANQPGSGDPIEGVAGAQAILDALEGVPVYCFRMFGAGGSALTTTLEGFDNTPDDGVPLLVYGSGTLDSAMTPGAVIRYYDMNPAHIIRECLTDATWGLGWHDDDIDDTSFTYSADTFYNEKFGLSLKWYREEEIREFISTTVLPCIDAYLYGSRSTGKFVLKPVRDDYDIDLIPILNEDDIIEFTEIKRRQPSEAISSVVVKYNNREKRKVGAHRVTNTAQAMQATKVQPPTTREYPGINVPALAIRVGQRDVVSLGSGLISGRVVANRKASVLNPGDAFRMVSDRHRLSGEVLRVTNQRFGDGRSNKIGLGIFQDVFKLAAAPLVDDGSSGGTWEPPSNEPLPVSPRMVVEMPFRELRQMMGEADLAATLASNPDAGVLQIAGASPTPDAANALIEVDAGSGYAEAGTPLDFAPGAFLSGAVTVDATAITVTGAIDLDVAELGTLAMIIGPTPLTSEIVRVDAIAGNTLTTARGFLDTVPQAHADGASIVFFDDISNTDFEIYTAGDTASVKLLTVTGVDTLDASAAPADDVLFASRAIRPLRPANVQVNGVGYGLVTAGGTADLATTWAERNRLIELSPVPSWTDATEGSEAGQTTVIEVLDPTGTTILTTHSGLTGTSFPVPVASFAGNVSGWLRFGSERDGYREWQAYQLQVAFTAVEAGAFVLTGNPVNLTQGVVGAVGAFVLTGNPVAFNVSMPVSVGSYTLTGNSVGLSTVLSMAADPASFALTGVAAGLTFVSTMTHSFEGYVLDNSNLTTYTFTAKNVGAAGAGRVIAVAVQTRTTSIGTPRQINSVTCNGNAMTLGPRITGGGTGQASVAWFYIVEPTGTTADFVVTFSNGTQNCAIATYRLFPVSSTPVDIVTSGTDLEVKTTGLALILVDSGRTATPQLDSYSWSGPDTPSRDLTDQINDQNGCLNLFSIPTSENDTTRDFTAAATGDTVVMVGISFQ
ncbi:MAG: VWA domain-containing protein [Mesorhizobium sp.]|uniref:phage tail protein n=1 Tax=Mesorhizobium sp. TaxID=1871066 RepID=UPI000FE5DD72|nr:phage tail protein [Mesorhizobium sp.]RWG13743.1 MAG: VWA domain-containing protein [Mesorhizobium sp.]